MLTRNGVTVGAVTPAFTGWKTGPVAVLGGGRTVWEDYDRAVSLGVTQFVVVNDIGAHFHGVIDHWFSLHPAYFPGWTSYRYGHTYGARIPYACHSNKVAPGVDFAWSNITACVSGLFAAKVCIYIGYSPILLCGIANDNAGHYFDHPRYTTTNESRGVTLEWEQSIETWFKGRVRSFAGNTAKWLGVPDVEWMKRTDSRE